MIKSLLLIAAAFVCMLGTALSLRKNPLATPKKAAKIEKTLSGAICQHVQATQPPVKSGQMTGPAPRSTL
jgi:hypothetical protein